MDAATWSKTVLPPRLRPRYRDIASPKKLLSSIVRAPGEFPKENACALIQE
jgi:hypothetical protein